jgi:acyl-CoA thioester hydrolase
MNVAYHSLVFDDAGEALVKSFGIGEVYTTRSRNSWMILEAHLTYQNAASLGDALRVETRVIDFSPKLARLYQEMFRGGELLATQKQMMLHVSLDTRRDAPFPDEILSRLAALHALHARIPAPAGIGRRSGIRRDT